MPMSELSAPAEAAGEQARELLQALRRIIRAVDMQSKRGARSIGLTTPQIVVLQAIRDHGDVASTTLSAAVELSPATLTTILDNLENRGLVERVRSRIDRRVVHARLTGEGETMLAAALPFLQRAFTERFTALPAGEREQMVAAFRRVAELMLGTVPQAAPAAVARGVDQPVGSTSL